MAKNIWRIIRHMFFWIYLLVICVPFAIVFDSILILLIILGDIFDNDLGAIPADIKGLLMFQWWRIKGDIIWQKLED